MAQAVALVSQDDGLAAEMERLEAEQERTRRERELKQRMAGIVDRLQRLADEQVARKSTIEDRWYEDLRGYHGRYEAAVEQSLREKKESRLFIGLTRSKTHAWEARLSDMLFPTDDKNWGISPTPVPDLVNATKHNPGDTEELVAKANALKANDPAQAAQLAAQGDQLAQQTAAAEEQMKQANRSCEAMGKQIDDQLEECQYNIRSRQVIHDSCKLGTGVMKGPVVKSRLRRRWSKPAATANDNQAASGAWGMMDAADPRPEYRRVDPWNFFPDMSASTVEEAEFFFERHLLNDKEVRKLAKLPGFDKDALRQLLTEKPREGLPTYLQMLRDITSAAGDALTMKYQVWEYHGPLEKEDILDIADAIGDEDMRSTIEPDPLDEINVVIWFCQGQLLMVGPHPLDSCDPLYSVFNFEKDDTCIFGFGVPYLMRDSQSAMNAAWRMMLDNGALATGPQVVVDKQQVEPVNGVWKMEPRKMWYRVKSATAGQTAPVFETFDIQSNQQYLQNIITLARQFADDETNLPLIAHGESASHITTTAQGMSMLMNSVNVVFRRVVKNYDDDMTTPNIRRAYDWNMQFNKREDIKGDYEVKARGSSVLLVRELQTQNLMNIANNFTVHPIFGPMTDARAVYKELLNSMMLGSDKIVKTPEQQAADEAKAAQTPPPPDPEMEKLKVQKQIADDLNATKMALAEIQKDIAIARVASDENVSIADINARLADKQKDRESNERQLAVEAAMTPPDTKGGGGTL